MQTAPEAPKPAEPEPATIAKRVQWLRETAGLSQRRVGTLIGSESRSHVSLIEARKDGSLKAETAEALCKVFGVSLPWLLRGEGDPPSAETIKAAASLADANTPKEPGPDAA